MPGPLSGIRVVEFSGIGPAPFCGMLLADMGAEVTCISREGAELDTAKRVFDRGKRSIALDLKQPHHAEVALRLVDRADVLIEGYRPGVMERLGFGPDICLSRRPSLIYGRMTGWGQYGPLARSAGHDINYIALAGVLAAIGSRANEPAIPLNLVGDLGGGSLYLAMGICAALVERQRSGRGQVIDAAITDGTISLMSPLLAGHKAGEWRDERASNLLDGGAPYYNIYETADHAHVAIGPIEPQFYALLLAKLGLSDAVWEAREDETRWPDLKDRFARIFQTRTRDEWCELLEGSDACFAPVLTLAEVESHPHNRARQNVIEVDGVRQGNVAPRFSRTPSQVTRAASEIGSDTIEILNELGVGVDTLTGN